MIRWLVSLWRGPLCDAGTGLGARPGCLKTAVHTTLVHPAGWSRGFRWCEEHKEAAAVAVGLRDAQADAREGTIHKGGQNLTYQLKERPPDPPAQRRPGAPLTDAQVRDADAELAALLAERDDLRRANAAGSAQVDVLRQEIARLEAEVIEARNDRPLLPASSVTWKIPMTGGQRDRLMAFAAAGEAEPRAGQLRAIVCMLETVEHALIAARAEADRLQAAMDAEPWRSASAKVNARMMMRAQEAEDAAGAAEQAALKAEAERDLLRRMLATTIERPSPAGGPAPAPGAAPGAVLAYLARYVLTGEGDAAEVDRLTAAAKAWALLVDEADTTVELAMVRRAAALVHEQPAAPSQEPTT